MHSPWSRLRLPLTATLLCDARTFLTVFTPRPHSKVAIVIVSFCVAFVNTKPPIIALFQGVKAYYDYKAEYKKNFNITWLLLYGAGLITVGILVLVNGK